jgi:hypothetical protein
MKKFLPVKILALMLLLATIGTRVQAQTNIAPSATVSAFGNAQAPFQWNQINDLNFGVCGTQQSFVWTPTPPNGTEWMLWEWTSPQRIQSIVIHHAQTTGRFLAGGTVQIWNGSTYVNVHTFSGLNQANCVNTVTLPFPVTSTQLRITNFQMGATGQNSNPNFREIEIIAAPPSFNDAGVVSIDTPVTFTTGLQPVVARIRNYGLNQITSVNVNWELNGVAQTPTTYTGLLDTIGGTGSISSTVNLGSVNFVNNQLYRIKAWTSSPNAQPDTINTNDTIIRLMRSPLNGSYTIGKTNCDFLTINEAVSILTNAGVTGPVVFNLADSLYDLSTGETFPITLTTAPGMSALNTVTFKPLFGNNVLVSSNQSSTVFVLSNARNFIIDGRDTFSSTDRSLALQNFNSVAVAGILNFQNDAISNIVRNTEFRFNSSVTTTGAINILGSNQFLGNDSNQIINNYFIRNAGGTYAVGILATGQSNVIQNNNNIIDGNEFNGFTFNGIQVNATNNGNGSFWRITNNSFYDTSATTLQLSTWSAINFSPGTGSGSVGNIISGNHIGGTEAMALGTPFVNNSNVTRVPIQFTASVGAPSLIYGNNIGNFFFPLTSATGSFTGIQVTGGVTNVDSNTISNILSFNNAIHIGINMSVFANYNVTHNQIHTIRHINTSTSGAIRGIVTSSGQTVNILNNTIKGLRTNSTNTGQNTGSSLIGINSQSSSNSVRIAGNAIGTINEPLVNAHISTSNVGIHGIIASSGINLIENNVIDGLILDSTAQSTFSTSTGAAINGILNFSGTAGQIIRNNTVTHLIQRSAATTQTSQINGICYASSGFTTLENNVIHSLFSRSTNTSTSTSAALNGINIASSGRVIITGNYIDSLVLLPATISSNQVNGMLVFGTSGNVVRNNTIKTLYNSFTTSSPGICGIQYVSSVVNQVCEGNTIFGLVNRHATSTGVVTGIRYLAATQALDNISTLSRNFVHSISSLSTSVNTINGIEIASGSITAANNVVRLGYDTMGIAYSNQVTINGILDNVFSTTTLNRYYHNTVYVGGTPSSGTTQTAAFRSASAGSQWQDIRNNIFVNVVSNTGSNGVNAAIALTTTPLTQSVINSNLLWAGSGLTNNFIGTGPGNATTMTGLNGWRRLSRTEANGIHGNPNFINPTGAVGAINLQPAASNLGEASGDVSVSALVQTDYNLNDRALNTPADMGAFSSGTNTLAADSVAPSIVFTALTNTTSFSSRTFTATITEMHSGVQDGALNPKVYFNKNNGTFFSTNGVLVSGNHRNGVWQFTIDSATLGGFAANDIVRYYVIAQDSVGNYGTLPAYAIALNTATVIQAPVTPLQYQISSPLPSIITVGPSGLFTTLTGTNGLFNAINNSFLQSNTTVLLEAGATITETGIIGLNQWLEVSGNTVGNFNYSLTIRPAGPSQVVLTGNVTTTDGLIRINGADRVSILGYDTLGTPSDTNLVVRNIATSQPALTLLNDATDNIFESVIFEGRNTGTAVTTGGVVRISPTSIATGNDNNRFTACHFRRDITNPTIPGTPGILFAASGTFNVNRNNDRLTLERNYFYNFNFNAISIGTGTGNDQVIKGNQFFQNEGFNHSTSPTVINFTPGNISDNDSIVDNIIGGNLKDLNGNWVVTTTATALTFTGINVTSGVNTGTVIQRNRIANILHNQTVASTFTAIQVNNGGGVARIEDNYIGDTLLVDNILHSGNTTLLAISCQTGSNAFINRNLIANLTNNNPNGTSVAINGIRAWNQTANLEIRNNIIWALKDSSANTSSTTGAAMIGINISSATNNILVEGNRINDLKNLSRTAASSSMVIGILNTSGLPIIRNNIVEQLLSRSSSTGTNTVATLIGIYSSSFTPNQIISDNIVRNLTYDNPIPVSAQIIGILQSSGSGHSIVRNLVHHLRTNSTSVNTTTSSAIIGISHAGSGSALNISQNTIHTLEGLNTSANSIVGILYQGTTTLVTNHVSRNFIHSFRLPASNGGRLIGIQQNSGSFTRYSNNMIRLGIDSSGTAYTNPIEINGILTDVAGNFEYFHNSIYIGGEPASGAAFTSALRLQGTPTGTQVYDVRNNILVNAVTNGTTASGKNFALRIAALPANAAGLVSNHNIMYAPGTGGFVAGTNILDYPTLNGLAGWKRATGYDLQSASVSPLFNNATGNAQDVDLHVAAANPIEASGDASIASLVTEDFDGECRSCSTAVDIGADAGNFTLSADAFAPSISYTPISNQGNTVGPCVLSGVNIKDNVGIPYQNSLVSAKLYYKKGVNGTYQVAGPISQVGLATNAFLNFEIQYPAIGGVSPGDSIFYFVMAEDSVGANLVSQRPFAIATNVNTLLNEPQVLDFYQILPVVPANTKFYVGSGQTYPSLTGAGGLFEYLNNNTIGGDVTAVITSNITEPGTFALNQIGVGGSGTGNYTITIRPDSSALTAPRILSGSNNLGLIRLNGADRVKIIGVPDLSTNQNLNNLLIRNSTNAPVVLFVNGATQNRLSNLIIEGANNTAFNAVNSGLISFAGSTSTTGNSQDTVSNCIIRNDASVNFPSGIPSTLINSVHAGLTLNSQNIIINNQLSNASVAYVNVDAGSGNEWVVSGNSCFFNLPLVTVNPLPIRFNGGLLSNGHNISSNIIGGTAPNAAGAAWTSNVQLAWNQIQIAVGIGAQTTVHGNIIRNMRFTQTSVGNQWNGIIVTSGRLAITNNIIGDSTVAGGLELNPPTQHNGISVTAAVTSPILISGNRISGIAINSAGNSTSFIGIFVSGGISNITNNIIGAVNIPNSITHNANSLLRGIFLQTTANIDPATQITNNVIANLTCLGGETAVNLGGIQSTGTTAANISNNTIFNLRSASSNTNLTLTALNVFGITVSASTVPGVRVNNNTIYSLEASNTGNFVSYASAINLQSVNNGQIIGNRIYDIRNLSTSSSVNPMSAATGILIASLTNAVDIHNNQITLGHNQTNNLQYNGIWQLNAGYNANYYNNTVVITGAATGNIPTYAFHRGANGVSESTSGVKAINNAFINARTGATAKSYAIANEVLGSVSGSGWLNTNYNFLSSANPATVGLWGNTDRTINEWRANTSNDANSWSEISGVVNPNTLFANIANGNLNVVTTTPLSWYLNGKGIAGTIIDNLNTDFNGNARGTTLGLGIDIGANEFSTSTTPPSASVSAAPANNGTSNLVFANRTIGRVEWGAAGAVPSSLTAVYYSGVNHPNTFATARFLNAYLNLSATGGSGYTYRVTMNYDPALMGTVLSESNLRLARYAAASWSVDSNTIINTGARTITNATNNTVMADFTGTDITAPLPVQLSYFVANAVERDVVLTWLTASEQNNRGFEVERSTDGSNFEYVGFVKGAGNTARLTRYGFTDNEALSLASTLYYRLKQIDFDGSFNYSNIVTVNTSNDDKFSSKVFPNPFESQFAVEVNTPQEGEAVLSLIDITGKVIGSKSVQLTTGRNLVDFTETDGIVSGVYFMQIVQGDYKAVQKVISILK